MKNRFKAYDKWNKRFVAPCQVAVNSSGETYVHGRSEGYDRKVVSVEILDYSGKKDRNGTELYRGDILKAELPLCEGKYDPEGDLKPKTILGVVVIRPAEGAKLLVKKIIPKGMMGIAIGRTLRIHQSQDLKIGDIYSNPELLEEDK